MVAIFKKRDNSKRFFLLTYMATMLMFYLPFFGEGSVGYNYVRTRYHWGPVEYSDYRSDTRISGLEPPTTSCPLQEYLQHH